MSCARQAKSVSYEDFTVTKLLHGVDVVLGMTWLQRWNPLIDWVQQVMYIRTAHGWDRIRGLMLDSAHCVGTVNILTNEDLASLESAPDITILRTPQFWTYAAGASSWTNVPNGGVRKDNTQNFDSSRSDRSEFFSFFTGTQEECTIRTGGRYCTKENEQQGCRATTAAFTQANAEIGQKG